MSNLDLFLIGWAIVATPGILLAAWMHARTRRLTAANKVNARYTAARKVQGLYLEHTHTPGTCSFGQHCALIQRDTERQAAADRVRGA